MLPPNAQSFVDALGAAGVTFRVGYEQPDGITPIYVRPKLRAVRHLVPPGAEIVGEVIRFWDEWVTAFCDSDAAR